MQPLYAKESLLKTCRKDIISRMQSDYNHKEVETRIYEMWEKGGYFTPRIDPLKKPFSMFLVPPNASGGMHIGNVLMVAIQDIIARYYRANGRPTLWIPSTDHGGYETQVTFERELDKEGKDRFQYTRNELFAEIKQYVEQNNQLIKKEIAATGASVDWSRFRFTLDDGSLKAAYAMFRKMMSDNLIYRRNYMVNYCHSCGTMLADIELKEKEAVLPLYFIKFKIKDSEEYLALATTRPEFIFATTHVLAHPADKKHAHHIGKTLMNPVTGGLVEVIESKRKFDPAQAEPFLTPFSPSYKVYDYGYTLFNTIPSRSLLDWNGNMVERYPGMKPADAREKEVAFLKELGAIEKVDESYVDSIFLCKRGHTVESIIMLTWFLKLDDEKKSLKKPALNALRKGGLSVIPKWKERDLTNWIEKMHDWPIARQTVWGIRIPVWYDISDPSRLIVWFIDKDDKKQCGNLKSFLDKGLPLEEIVHGLERVYASEGTKWVLERETGKSYLPETDTLDTWFSSGNWGTAVFGDLDSPDFLYFYPSEILVIGHDLIRLSVARKIFLSYYMTGRLPFKTVYLHNLIKGADGQKMSKSLGNATSLEYYLDTFGADVTRMALISYTSIQDDFIFEEGRLLSFQKFSRALWEKDELISLANQYSPEFSKSMQLSSKDKLALEAIDKLAVSVSSYLDKYLLAQAQEVLCSFLSYLDEYVRSMDTKVNTYVTLSVFRHIYGKYLILLHPFMPFMTEELHIKLYDSSIPLAITSWPRKT
jgi:valyl-tRNA synthetase